MGAGRIASSLSTTPIVVFVHIHYTETWPVLRRRIEQAFRVPFRLVVTTTAETRQIEPPVSAWMQDCEIVRVPNRGRDVLPFLIALEAAGPFEIGLKLHGKRSVHRLDGEAWRDALVSSLLPSADGVENLVRRMQEDDRLSLVAPVASLCSIDRHTGDNAASLRSVAATLDIDLPEATARTPFFCAGTMFWFRRDALARVARDDLADLFADESGQTDGTAAHAFERLFAVIAEIDGGIAVTVDVAVATDRQTTTDELRAAARQRMDVDETFVRLPGPLAAFVMRRARFAVPLYLALPVSIRRTIKSALTGALGLARR